MGEKDISKNTVATWLKVIGFLENDHIKQHCTITNQNVKVPVESEGGIGDVSVESKIRSSIEV